MAADDIPELYQRHAAAFDALRGRDLMERGWLDRFTAAMPPGAAILDLGCGMAEPIAAYLIGRGFRVTGVDCSPSLLGLARARFPDQSWHLLDMRSLDLASSFAGVLAWNSFFHLSQADQRSMFAVFARHVAPGGALMLTSGPAEGVAMGIFEGDALFHASLNPSEYRDLLDQHGFAVEAWHPEDAGCGGHSIWLARMLAGVSSASSA
jgi:SAM-dependent methyltransferase